MKVGPELDALVAEKVMGWEKDCPEAAGWWEGSQYAVSNENGLPARGEDGDADRWRPSEDIGQAWEVVEKMKTDTEPWPGTICRQKNSLGIWEWYVELGEAGDAFASSQSAPHAICLAALKAVGVELAQETAA